MAIRKTIQIGDPRLHKLVKQVKPLQLADLGDLVQDLADTMHDMGLTGLAAPQFGVDLAVFITEIYPNKHRATSITDDLRVYINPRILELSQQVTTIYEGCGSVVSADLFGPVIRAQIVTIEAEDLQGETFRLKADGLLGRVILHEYDHLQGILFTQKVSDYSKLLNFENYQKYIRNTDLQTQNMLVTIKELN